MINHRNSPTLTAVICTAALIFWGSVHAAQIAVSCGAVGKELEMCKRDLEEWSRKTGHNAKSVSTPSSSSERLVLYQQLLAAGAADIDVFQLDVVWPGILGNHFIDLQEFAGERTSTFFPEIVANNTVDGRLVAMPFFADAGVLYFRRDLLQKHGQPVPTTWTELAASGRVIQDAERAAGNTGLWGFVWQGRADEGLTCNALEWIASRNGGTIVAPTGAITVDNPRSIAALSEAASWVGAISPEGVLSYAEEESRGIFQSGNAVFMRNWPYAWALANGPGSPVRGKVGVTVLPKGGIDGRHAATLGGWQLGVSKYSKHPEVAADLVMFMTSRGAQKRRAIESAAPPTIPALYDDPDVLQAAPFFAELHATLLHAVARPAAATRNHYNRVSSAFWSAAHEVIAGQTDAEVAIQRLQHDLQRISRGGRW